MSVFDIKEEAFEVIIDGKKYVGHLAYQELSPRPLVLIFPNVAGLKGFDQQKAYEMAELGYVGLAVDLYGDHTIPFKDREDHLAKWLFHMHQAGFQINILIFRRIYRTFKN